MQKYKIEAYVPEVAFDKIQSALKEFEFGKIGNYDCCMNWYEVNSSWRAMKGANPYQGKVGEIENAKEIKLEFVCDENELDKAVKAIKDNHPYEEVCVNIIPLFDLEK